MKSVNGKNIVLAIGDMHHPFAHPDCVPFLVAVKKKYKPTDVVCMGDEIDASKLSKYSVNPDGLSAGEELTKAVEKLKEVYAEFPTVKVCTSNHTIRIYKKAFDAGIPRAFLKSYEEFLEAPAGWQWAERWEIDNVVYEHGEPGSGPNAARNAAMMNMKSTVIGHVHSYAGIYDFANFHTELFGFNVGCLIDSTQPAFDYAKLNRAKPILGVGIIKQGKPEYVYMRRDSKGRWTGKL